MTSLTLLLSVMGGLRQKSRALIEDMGANVFVILPGETTEVADAGLTAGKKEMLQASLPGTIVSGLRSFDVHVSGFTHPVRVFAADDNYFRIHSWKLKSGRLIDKADQLSASRSALVTDTLANDANWMLGQSVFLGRTPFSIVGIVERPGAALESETSETSFVPNSRTLFVPLSASRQWMDSDSLREDSLDAVEVKVPGRSPLETDAAAARRILSGRTESEAFRWITPETVLANARKLQRTIGLTAGSVAFLCLILGGSTLMSLMVANVRERVMEIALRRALGATAVDIAALFISEACLVTFSASVLGIAAATLLLLFSSGLFYLPVSLSPSLLVIPLLAAVLLGMLFSYLPVRMAVAVTPAEALRND
jgi:ABC-type antimicrobial peptide transport system permease subunit